MANSNQPHSLPVLHLVILKFANEKARSFFFLRVYEGLTVQSVQVSKIFWKLFTSPSASPDHYLTVAGIVCLNNH